MTLKNAVKVYKVEVLNEKTGRWVNPLAGTGYTMVYEDYKNAVKCCNSYIMNERKGRVRTMIEGYNDGGRRKCIDAKRA